jgi:hypothetical protein
MGPTLKKVGTSWGIMGYGGWLRNPAPPCTTYKTTVDTLYTYENNGIIHISTGAGS